MFKNQMVQMLIDLQKSGVRVHLTEDGLKEFLRLMDDSEVKVIMENVG